MPRFAGRRRKPSSHPTNHLGKQARFAEDDFSTAANSHHTEHKSFRAVAIYLGGEFASHPVSRILSVRFSGFLLTAAVSIPASPSGPK